MGPLVHIYQELNRFKGQLQVEDWTVLESSQSSGVRTGKLEMPDSDSKDDLAIGALAGKG